jgi:hypothetical protein
VRMAREWIKVAKHHLDAGRQHLRKGKHRIKIAIVDTGVDLDNHVISPYEKRVKFLRGTAADNIDIDGHGTLVVQLLLSLARNVEVYVYKVTERRGCLELSEERIKELAEVSREGRMKRASSLAVRLTSPPGYSRSLPETPAQQKRGGWRPGHYRTQDHWNRHPQPLFRFS